MIIYSALALGEKFSLVPTASPDGELVSRLKSRGEAFVLLLPSLKYDLFVEGYSREGEPLLNNIASAYAAAAFLSGVRGIPFEELSVGSPEEEYRAVRLEDDTVSIELHPKTCLSGELSLSLLGADTQYRVSSCKYGRIALVGCRDIQCFDTEALPLVTSGHNHFCACGAPSHADNPSGAEYSFVKQPVCGALVYCRGCGEVRARAYFPKDDLDFRLAAVGGLLALSPGAPRVMLDCNGVRYTLMRCGGRLLLSSRVSFSGKEAL
ncbi:MAG: hypothetical protein IJ488_05660 [Clostridia bacterium]|nr:hypothetical protein [Clostridia bacterium]